MYAYGFLHNNLEQHIALYNLELSVSQKVRNGRVSLFLLDCVRLTVSCEITLNYISKYITLNFVYLRKSRMAGSLFFIRLCRLDRFLGKNPEQHVALYNPELSVSQKVRNGRVRLLLLDCTLDCFL